MDSQSFEEIGDATAKKIVDKLSQGEFVEAFIAAVKAEADLSGHVDISKGMVEDFMRKCMIYYPRLSEEEKPDNGQGANADPIVNLFACCICHKILEDPVTLPCEEFGHSVCKNCAVGINECPKCKSTFSPLYTSRLNVSFTVQQLLEHFFPVLSDIVRIKKEGNRFFQMEKYKEALEKYNQALRIGGNDAVLLSNRSSTYLRLGDIEKSLDDANLAIQLRPGWTKSYFRKVLALIQKGAISEAIISAFQMVLLDRDILQLRELLPMLTWWFLLPKDLQNNKDIPPLSISKIRTTNLELEENLRLIEGFLEQAKLRFCKGQTDSSIEVPTPITSTVIPTVVEELLTCSLCYRLLHKAVTPNCGHSFCKECLQRVLDFKPSCPQCRQDLSEFLSTRHFCTTEIIEKTAMLLLPALYEEREAVHRKEMQSLSIIPDSNTEIAVFVLSTAWPGVPLSLHVFEPRYRLMMRRAVESGSNLFGMCAYTGEESGFADVGTTLRISDIQYFEDGRCLVISTGEKRFRVLSRGIRDGYSTAKFEYIVDEHVPVDQLAAVQALQDTVYDKIQRWLNNLGPARYAAVCETFGSYPPKADLSVYNSEGPKWIWWIVAVLSSVRNTYSGLLNDTSVASRMRTVSLAISDLSARFFRSAS